MHEHSLAVSENGTKKYDFNFFILIQFFLMLNFVYFALAINTVNGLMSKPDIFYAAF